MFVFKIRSNDFEVFFTFGSKARVHEGGAVLSNSFRDELIEPNMPSSLSFHGAGHCAWSGCANWYWYQEYILRLFPPIVGSFFCVRRDDHCGERGFLSTSSPGVEADIGAERIGGAHNISM